jgi:hypothetical protein
MMMTEKANLNDAELDALFGAAAQNAPDPSPELLARVLGDADVAADTRVAQQRVKSTRSWRTKFGALIGGVGGWPGFAGLASVTVAGIWIGYVQPESLTGLTDGYLATSAVYDLADFMPSVDGILGEG